MNKTKFGILCLLLFCVSIVKAQKIIEITDSKGTAFISGDVSPNQAKKKCP